MNKLDSTIIKAVIQKINLGELEAKRFSSGVVNRVYDIGGKYV